MWLEIATPYITVDIVNVLEREKTDDVKLTHREDPLRFCTTAICVTVRQKRLPSNLAIFQRSIATRTIARRVTIN